MLTKYEFQDASPIATPTNPNMHLGLKCDVNRDETCVAFPYNKVAWGVLCLSS